MNIFSVSVQYDNKGTAMVESFAGPHSIDDLFHWLIQSGQYSRIDCTKTFDVKTEVINRMTDK